MSKNKQLYVCVQNQLVPVTEEVYREYYKMKRRERYLEELDDVKGKFLYSDMDTDETLGEETIPDVYAESVENILINRIMTEKLRKCLDFLTDAERELIDMLFFKGYSEREYSKITGIQRDNRRYKYIVSQSDSGNVQSGLV